MALQDALRGQFPISRTNTNAIRMDTTKTLPAAAAEIFNILDPYDSTERKRIQAAVSALLGDDNATPNQLHEDEQHFGKSATRWLDRHRIVNGMIERTFHIEGGRVEIIAHRVPGSSKREQTVNAYLLTGIRALLESDTAKFSDDEALQLCKTVGCHDTKNHSSNRRELRNRVTGAKSSGYTLSVPGLDAAAEVVRQLGLD